MGLFADKFRYSDTHRCMSKWRKDKSIIKNMRILDARSESGEKYGCVLGADGKKYDLKKARNELLHYMSPDEFWDVCVGDSSIFLAKADGSYVNSREFSADSTASIILSCWRRCDNVVDNMRAMSELSKKNVKYVFIKGVRGKYRITKIIKKLTKNLKTEELWELRTKDLESSS